MKEMIVGRRNINSTLLIQPKKEEEQDQARVKPIDENEEGAVDCGICCFSYK